MRPRCYRPVAAFPRFGDPERPVRTRSGLRTRSKGAVLLRRAAVPPAFDTPPIAARCTPDGGCRRLRRIPRAWDNWRPRTPPCFQISPADAGAVRIPAPVRVDRAAAVAGSPSRIRGVPGPGGLHRYLCPSVAAGRRRDRLPDGEDAPVQYDDAKVAALDRVRVHVAGRVQQPGAVYPVNLALNPKLHASPFDGELSNRPRPAAELPAADDANEGAAPPWPIRPRDRRVEAPVALAVPGAGPNPGRPQRPFPRAADGKGLDPGCRAPAESAIAPVVRRSRGGAVGLTVRDCRSRLRLRCELLPHTEFPYPPTDPIRRNRQTRGRSRRPATQTP